MLSYIFLVLVPSLLFQPELPPLYLLGVKTSELILDFISDPDKFSLYIFCGPGGCRRIVKPDMKPFTHLARKNRAGFLGIPAYRYYIIPGIV